MIPKILRYFAKRSHDVRIQLLLATLYGLTSIYGLSGALSIIMKARKLTNVKRRNRVTTSTVKGPQ